MRGRVLVLFGMFAATTPRNDASPAVGQWDVRAAYKYVSEAYGGYHFNVQPWPQCRRRHLRLLRRPLQLSQLRQLGLPAVVCFVQHALVLQWACASSGSPRHHLKIEPWFINGWQSYNKFNGHPGIGGQLKWTPKPWLNVIANQYAVGNDNIGLPNRGRYHTDDSVEIKYYDKPTKAAMASTRWRSPSRAIWDAKPATA